MDAPQNPSPAAVATPGPDDDFSGRSLGEFQILRRLGVGGMGQVYLAEQSSLKRKVALKILRAELAANPTALKRFRAEAEACAKLTHANIVQVYAIGEHEGLPYMALEYVEGRNLRDFLNRKGSPDLPIAISIMKQIAAALHRAGELGFVHRDIKPENILLTRKGEVKVADFGLSRCFSDSPQQLNLTQSGVAMGTPLYMSPEQVQGKAVDPRSDIYSFGVTCYHLLAGQPPFRGRSAFDVAIQHVQNEPPPLASFRPDLPPDLLALIHRMMAKNPDDRPQNAKEIIRDLNRIRESLSGHIPTVSPVAFNSGVMAGQSSSSATLTVQATSEFAGLASPPVEPRRKRNFATAGIIGALLAIALGGVSLRWIVNRLGAKAASRPTLVDAPPTPVLASDERFAIEAARQYADPRDAEAVRKGLAFQIDLAVYYWKRHRLEDAESHLRALQDRSYSVKFTKETRGDHPYKIFARFGLAITLAFRDKAKESTDTLAFMLTQFQPGFGLNVLGLGPIDHLELRKVVADALNRNAVNLKLDKFTDRYAHLEGLRRPPDPAGKFRPIFGGKKT